jgi:putative spermidine/putrescine transport system ATP-binding protein
VTGAAAQTITGLPNTFSIRPEKIRLEAPKVSVPADCYSIGGRIRDVVYLGMHTRYLVELDGGGDLTVVQQNLESTSMDVLAAKGRSVRLVWQRDHVRRIVQG